MSKLKILVQTVFHLMAASVIFCGLLTHYVNHSANRGMVGALDDEVFRADVLSPIVLLFALSACLWALAWITFKFIVTAFETSKKPVVLRKATGTIITETLIIMPVYLLLTFGLLQMTVNSIAGLLSTLATYEAARTLAVWGPEVGNDRGFGEVTQDHATQAARLAAAGVLAPVTPVSQTAVALCLGDAGQERINRLLAGLSGTGTLPTGGGSSEGGAIWRALDGDMGMGQRAGDKLRLAYCATSVSYPNGSIVTGSTSRDRNAFVTSLEYRHPAAFPLVGVIFRSPGNLFPWSTLDVAHFRREYELTQQITPNVNMPQAGVIQSLVQGTFSAPGRVGGL